MSNIVEANEYTKLPVAAKGWVVPKKPQKIGRERRVRGHVTLKAGSSLKVGAVTYDRAEEMLQAMREETKKVTDRQRYPDQDEFENASKQAGKGIWSHQLTKQILKLNANLFLEDSILVPGCAAFYKMVDGKKKPTGASFRKGLIPEFTIMKPNVEISGTKIDSMGITYGWRTVLMRLVKSGDLSYPQVLKVWGEVHYGDSRGKHWNLNIRAYRV